MNRNGYRETDLGQIPTDWEVTPLGNVVSIRGEGTQPSSKGTAKYVGLEHIDSASPKLKRWGIESEVRSSKNKFYAGDILYGKLRPYLDKVALAEWEGICATDILVFNAEKLKGSPEYLVNLLHTAEFLNFAISTTTGVNHPRTSWNSVSRFTFGLPPLPEQKKIAAILSKIQQAIEIQDKVIERVKELKKALMAKLFTEGLYGEELKETEIGVMPKSWELVDLAQVADIVYGAQAAVAHATDSSIGTPIFTNINITNDGELDLQTIRYYKVPENKRDRLILKHGDILFNWRSGSREHVGKTAIFGLDGEYTFSSFILRFRAKDKMRNTFLFYTLQYLKQIGYFSQFRQVSSVNSVFNASSSATIPIAVPSMAEQEEIAEALAKAIAKVRCERERKKRLNSLFQGMLHKLMTGQIRVNNIEIPFDA